MQYFVLLCTQDIVPRLFALLLVETSEVVKVQPQLDELLTREAPDCCGGYMMRVTNIDLLELLNDMTVELLVPGNMDNALDEFLLNVNLSLGRHAISPSSGNLVNLCPYYTAGQDIFHADLEEKIAETDDPEVYRKYFQRLVTN
jgi:hypothetical protein